MSAKKSVLIVSIIIFITAIPGRADVLHDATAIDVSGGENHTLVLTASQSVWGCGDNSHYQLGIGDNSTAEWTLARVWAGDMNTISGYLEDIDAIDAGWKHSLALDVNGLVWAWGNNSEGAVGLALDPDSATLFVTYEGSNEGSDIIEMVNARTMVSEQKALHRTRNYDIMLYKPNIH